MLRSREILKAIKRDDLKPRNKKEKAAFYFYKIALSFGAKGDVFAQPKGNRSAKNIYKDFQVYSRRLKLATIENMEFSKLIKTYDTDETLFYLDPPYVGTESYYSNTQGFGINQHELLASMLKEVKGRFILSYNDCEVIRDLYNGFNFKEVSVNYSLNAKYRRDRGELIITNY